MDPFKMGLDVIEVISDAIHTRVEWGRDENRLITATDTLAHDCFVFLYPKIKCIARIQYYIMGLLKFPIMK
jgi:hypothetical protein